MEEQNRLLYYYYFLFAARVTGEKIIMQTLLWMSQRKRTDFVYFQEGRNIFPTHFQEGKKEAAKLVRNDMFTAQITLVEVSSAPVQI